MTTLSECLSFLLVTNIFRLKTRHLGIPQSLILYSASLGHSDASDKMNPGQVHGSMVGLSLPSSPVYDENSSAVMSFLMRQGRKKEQTHFFPSMVGKDLAKKRSLCTCCMGTGLSSATRLWFGLGKWNWGPTQARRGWSNSWDPAATLGSAKLPEGLHPPLALDSSAWTHELPYCAGAPMQHISSAGFICRRLGLLYRGLNGNECFTLVLQPSTLMRKIQGDRWDKLRGKWGDGNA